VRLNSAKLNELERERETGLPSCAIYGLGISGPATCEASRRTAENALIMLFSSATVIHVRAAPLLNTRVRFLRHIKPPVWPIDTRKSGR